MEKKDKSTTKKNIEEKEHLSTCGEEKSERSSFKTEKVKKP